MKRHTSSIWQMARLAIGLLFLMATLLSACGTTPSATTPDGTSPLVFDIELGDMYIKPDHIEVPAGQAFVFNVTNVGAMVHDVKVDGITGSSELPAGGSETVNMAALTKSVEAWCTLPGHRESGMSMRITVIGDTGAEHEDATHTVTSAANTSDPANATIDTKAMPTANWQARDPQLPAAPSGTLHTIKVNMTETLIEVAPGVTQMMWTFDNQVPGPIYRGKVGDTFRFELVNQGKMGHSIDFHAGKVAWDDEMRTLQPGESLIYEYTAEYAGAYMYHCGTAPALHHIGNGMYGAIIIDPPTLAPVAQEFFVVQSELYLGPEGKEGSLTKMVNEQWDAVVFNGYYNQYKFAPITVATNTRYRVWVINDGPSENSAFHIVGTVFDTVYKEGAYLLQPDAGRGGSQVLDLQPAQGGFVEFSFAEDGLYPMVTHKFANVGKGALGFFAAGDADISKLGGH
jgi:nitrite reductase (NO-forming)